MNVLMGAQMGMEAMLIHLDLPFTPRIDGAVIPKPVLDQFAQGATPDVPMLIGSATEDGGLVGDALLNLIFGNDFSGHVKRLIGDEAEDVLARYPNNSSDVLRTPMAQFTTDWIFTANARSAAANFAQGGRSAYLYVNTARFPPGHPGETAGAFHGYAFGNGMLNALEWDPDGVFDPLSQRMMRRLGAFIHSGDPNIEGLPKWDTYNQESDSYLLVDHATDTPSKGLRPLDLDPLQRAIESRGQ